MAADDGVEAWFPWDGDEDHTDGPFDFLTRHHDYSYKWVPVHKVTERADGGR